MATAFRSDAKARSRCSLSSVDQPTTRRANRSMATARYSQPSFVQMYEMSAPHFSSGPAAAKSRSSKFGATGQAWWLSVVRLNLRFCRARSPFSRIKRAVRRRPNGKPLSRSSRVMRGLP